MQSSSPQRGEVVLRHFREWFSHDGRPCHQDDIDRLSQTSLVHSKRFAQQSSRPAPHHCIPNPPAGNDTHPAGRAGRQANPVQNQATAGETSPLVAGTRKIAGLFDTTLPGQSKGRQRRGIHDRNLGLNWSQAFSAHAAAVPEDGAPTLGGIAAEEAVLPFPADL